MCLSRDKEQLNLLRQQMLESTKVAENLRKELIVYEKLYKLSYEGRNIELQTDGMYLWYSEIWKDRLSLFLKSYPLYFLP